MLVPESIQQPVNAIMDRSMNQHLAQDTHGERSEKAQNGVKLTSLQLSSNRHPMIHIHVTKV